MRSDLRVMENLIANFLSKYASLYGSEEVKNKHHHLIHYPSSIANYGPSFYTNTMIHERALRKIKPMIRGRKGIIKQIATAASFQTYWFLEALSKKDSHLSAGRKVGLVRSSKSCSSASYKLLSSIPSELSNRIPDNAIIHKKIRHNGSLFFQNGVVCKNAIQDDWLHHELKLSEILMLFSLDNELFLVLQDLHFHQYREDYVAVEVQQLNFEDATPYIISTSMLSVSRCFSMKAIMPNFSIQQTKNKIVIIDSLPYKMYF